MIKRLKFGALTAAVVAMFVAPLTGCGVKGDPLPPEKPAELGRGRPTYRRATEGMQIEKTKRRAVPGTSADEEEEEDDTE